MIGEGEYGADGDKVEPSGVEPVDSQRVDFGSEAVARETTQHGS